MNLKNKKILVTGGQGYLGSFLVDKLKEEQAEVFIFDTKITTSSNNFLVDITKKEEVKLAVNKIQPDLVFHLAANLDRARNFDNFERINQVNHIGTYNLLTALKDTAYQNFVFISTSEVYGKNKAPFHENQIPDPVSPYSLTKVYSENLVKTFSETYHKGYTILRLFNFFGKGMPEQFFIPQMIEALQNKISFDMTQGEQTRDFLYIDDVVKGLLLVASNNATNQTYNLCSGEAVSLKKLVKTLHKQLNSKCIVNFGALPYRENEVWNMLGDNSKIKKKLGFEVHYTIERAIKELITTTK